MVEDFPQIVGHNSYYREVITMTMIIEMDHSGKNYILRRDILICMVPLN